MKSFNKIIIILFLSILLVYVTNLTGMPDSILLFKGEKLNLETAFGIYVVGSEDSIPMEEQTLQASSTLKNYDTIETSTVTLRLFNIIPVKQIEVNTIPTTTVIPLGNIVGLKLYTEGVLVVGMTDIDGQKPYLNSGIQEGDMIIKVNEKEISGTRELIECVNSSNGENMEIKYVRGGEEAVTEISPAKTTSNEYKLGLWVRDGAAGIGTATYYEPMAEKFAVLRTWHNRYRYRRSYNYS